MIWNFLTDSVVEASSIHDFKKKLNKYLQMSNGNGVQTTA